VFVYGKSVQHSVCNTLAYWAHLLVAKKIKCHKYLKMCQNVYAGALLANVRLGIKCSSETNSLACLSAFLNSSNFIYSDKILINLRSQNCYRSVQKFGTGKKIASMYLD
jgi:hypothetical protein